MVSWEEPSELFIKVPPKFITKYSDKVSSGVSAFYNQISSSLSRSTLESFYLEDVGTFGSQGSLLMVLFPQNWENFLVQTSIPKIVPRLPPIRFVENLSYDQVDEVCDRLVRCGKWRLLGPYYWVLREDKLIPTTAGIGVICQLAAGVTELEFVFDEIRNICS